MRKDKKIFGMILTGALFVIPWITFADDLLVDGDLQVNSNATIYGTSALLGRLNLIGPDGGSIPWDTSYNGHLIRSDIPGNVLTIQHMISNSFSVIRYVSFDGLEHSALGYANTGADNFYKGIVFWDAINPTVGGTSFQVMRIISTLKDGGGSFYPQTRVEFSPDGTITLFYLSPPVGRQEIII